MAVSNELLIGIFHKGQGSAFAADEQYRIDQFGGTIPCVGDLIVDPGMPPDGDRNDPKQRTVLEVAARYFIPGDGSNTAPQVALLVESRRGRKSEVNIL